MQVFVPISSLTVPSAEATTETPGGDAIEVIVEDVLKQDSFAVYISTERENEVLEKILYKEPAFRLAEEVELNGKTLQYYIRSVE